MLSSVRGSVLRSCLSTLKKPSSSSSTALSSLPGTSAVVSRTSFLPPPARTYVTAIWKNTKNSEIAEAYSRTENIFKTYKPVTPGLRHLRRPLSPHLYKGRPVRLLTIPKRKKGGRNADGHITVRHRGGGHKQRIRTLDFKRMAAGVHDVVRIEYDPGRSAHIALLCNRATTAEGLEKWSYIIATEGMRAGDQVQSFRQGIPEGFIPGFELPKETLEEEGASNEGASSSHSLALGILRSMTLKPGNVLPLKLIPPGTVINSVTLKPEGPALLVRSAGTFAQVVSHEDNGKYTHVRLQSGEVRKVLKDCAATVGKVSNPLWKNRSLGKAGRRRWLGWRPSVRGVAMNAYVASFFSLRPSLTRLPT